MKRTTAGVFYFRRYYSKRFESRLHKRSLWSRLINPSLKNLRPACFPVFLPSVVKTIPPGWAVATVPGHKAGGSSGIRVLAALAAREAGAADLTGVLYRKYSIHKLQNGGDRSLGVHLRSVASRKSVRGRRILLLDDVTVTGISLLACRKVLLKAGARRVRMVALAKGRYITREVLYNH